MDPITIALLGLGGAALFNGLATHRLSKRVDDLGETTDLALTRASTPSLPPPPDKTSSQLEAEMGQFSSIAAEHRYKVIGYERDIRRIQHEMAFLPLQSTLEQATRGARVIFDIGTLIHQERTRKAELAKLLAGTPLKKESAVSTAKQEAAKEAEIVKRFAALSQELQKEGCSKEEAARLAQQAYVRFKNKPLIEELTRG